MSIPLTYKFVAYNSTGVTLGAGAVNLYFRRWKFVNGILTYEASIKNLTNAGTINNNAQGDIGATQSNATDVYLGGIGGFFEVLTTSTPTGDVSLFLLVSKDGGTSWQTERDLPLSTINFTAATTKSRQFSF